MLDALYWIAAALGLVGALNGNRVAWPLLGSFAFYQYASLTGLAFDPVLWARVDRLVLLGLALAMLLKRYETWRDAVGEFTILLLFLPLFYAYKLPEAPAHVLSMTAAIAQLLIVFPARKAWHDLRATIERVDPFDDFNLRALA